MGAVEDLPIALPTQRMKILKGIADFESERQYVASLVSRSRENERMMMEKDFMTLKEVAERLGVHPNTLRNLVKAGNGPRAVKVGSSYKIRNSDYEAWIEANSTVPAEPKAESSTKRPKRKHTKDD